MSQGVYVLKSFVEGSDESLFSIYNLPYGVFSHQTSSLHIGVAIGDCVLDLTLLENEGLLKIHEQQRYFDKGTLNAFAESGPAIWAMVRKRIQTLLSVENQELQDQSALLSRVLIDRREITLHLPFKTEAFTDFYASEHHATNVGRLFRGEANALLPNWKHLPVAYNGRASTLFVSGTPIRRPMGLRLLPNQENPIFSSSQKLDFELEMGVFVGVGNPDGRPISVHEAPHHLFGMVLLNDWSARDIQAFEYQPLGPFLSKSFATSISPWVIPMQVIRESMVLRPSQDPRPADYLYHPVCQPDIELRVELIEAKDGSRTLLCETNSKELYWSLDQMLAHHTVNHCIMRTGDLIGTGTISGPKRDQWGSLLEMAFNGKEPVKLNNGETRSFLNDGDTIVISGFCRVGDRKLGFGELWGTVI